MAQTNAERFRQMLAGDPTLKERLMQAFGDFEGDSTDDRQVFESVVRPIAESAGIELSYAEAMEAIAVADEFGVELPFEVLDGIVGGVGPIYKMLISGVFMSAMVFTSAPAVAFAAGASEAASISQVRDVQDFPAEPEVSYEADFDNADIATPEGISATHDGLVLSGSAPELVTEAALSSATSTLGATQAAAPSPSGQNDWDRTSKTLDYTRDALGYVSKDAQDIARYGQVTFNFIKAGCLGDYSAAFGGGVELLKLIGVLQKESDVSNKAIYSEVKELRALIEGMSERLDENTKQTYQNRLVAFDNAVGVLDIDCKTAETMFQKAAKIAEERHEGLGEVVEMPTRPVVDELVLPDEPPASSGIPQPVAPDVPEPPAEPERPATISPFLTDMSTTEALLQEYDANHAQWQEDYDAWNAEYGDAWRAYQQELAAWSEAEAPIRRAHADWEDECLRLQQEHDQQVAEAEAWDEDAAMAEWEAAKQADAGPYTQRLIKIMETEEREGNKDFKNFTKTMDSIESNYKLVAVECAKQEGSSPFHAFDSYWNFYFNFDTQGYYLRQAYRSGAEFQLKRSYALLGAYYDIASYDGSQDEADPRQSLTDALTAALNGIEAFPAGNSPDSVMGATSGMAGFTYNTPVYSPTLNRTFNRSMVRWSLASIGTGDFYSEDAVKAYCSRLHGHTVAEDLKLAGLMVDYDSSWNDWLASRGKTDRISPERYLGLGVNHEVTGGKWLTRYVPFDATSYQLRDYNEDDGYTVIFLINN